MTQEMKALMDQFRLMANDCIKIGLENSLTSMKSLSLKAYHELDYGIPSCYHMKRWQRNQNRLTRLQSYQSMG